MDVREYRSTDLQACRLLFVQLVEHHREIYADPTIGGDDPGSEFDKYLALPDRVITWVAAEGDSIVGLTGLLWADEESTIEPVVVDRSRRRTGVGRTLIETAIDESRRRGAKYINIKPVARNSTAIQTFHELGFRTLGHLQLFMSVEHDDSDWIAGPQIHGREFDC